MSTYCKNHLLTIYKKKFRKKEILRKLFSSGATHETTTVTCFSRFHQNYHKHTDLVQNNYYR